MCVCVLSVSFDILKKAFRALVKSEQIPRRWCAEMDVRKDESHLKLLQTPEPHPRRARAPGNDRPAERGTCYFPLLLIRYERAMGYIHGKMGCDPLSSIFFLVLRTSGLKKHNGQ